MYYLVQAMENYTNSVLPSFTKLFPSRTLAEAYASKIVANRCGFDFAEITPLAVECDPLADLSPKEYELATAPL